jgi:two-component system chemotaxis sensor kinase CheA
LRSGCALEAVKDVFIFFEDDSEITILPLDGPPAAPAVVAASPAAGEPAAEPARETVTVERAAATVRVAADKLDRLVNLVGELVINQSRLTQAAARHSDQDLAVPVEEIERLVSELRDSVLGIRMTPIGATFNRFKRLVHDLSDELGKEIELITKGAETELDKTVLDQLGDPLVHLIRNSIDHGVETAETRVERGKPRRGTVRLTAAHVGSNVVVSVSDDGKGIDPVALRAKAVEKQLIAADASLSESEILNLIFRPGLSTAKEVTNISGRGVGMDVVKRQIETLRGTIHVTSAPGQGTTIALTLPLTLAIIDGLLIQVGGDQFIVPMSAVTENVELTRADRGRNNGRNVFAVRGELIPYIDLRAHFAIGGQPPDIEKIVIVRHQDQRVGLTVDRVLGSHQTVIQSLGRFYKGTEVVSGATITGDGRVALILDIAGLVRFTSRTDHSSMGPPPCLATPPVSGSDRTVLATH